MTVGMMAPAAVPAIRHVVTNTVPRRHTAICFLVGYFAVWCAYPLILRLVLAAGPGGRWTGAGALAIAAAWQLTAAKRACLRACGSARTLAAHGWAARLGALRFGGWHGLACVGSCWALMLAMLTVGPAGMAPLAGVLWLERIHGRARPRTTAAALAILAALTLPYR